MALVKYLLFFSLSILALTACQSHKKELVEGFYEEGNGTIDTTQFNLLFDKEKIFRINPDILASAIAEYNCLDSRAVGYAGVMTEQYSRYLCMEKYTPEIDLIRLADHKNPVVRVYAFWALVSRNSSAAIPIFKKHVNDKETLESFSGCDKSNSGVNKHMLGCLQPYKGKTSIALSKAEFKKYLKIITGTDNESALYF